MIQCRAGQTVDVPRFAINEDPNLGCHFHEPTVCKQQPLSLQKFSQPTSSSTSLSLALYKSLHRGFKLGVQAKPQNWPFFKDDKTSVLNAICHDWMNRQTGERLCPYGACCALHIESDCALFCSGTDFPCCLTTSMSSAPCLESDRAIISNGT